MTADKHRLCRGLVPHQSDFDKLDSAQRVLAYYPRQAKYGKLQARVMNPVAG
jgi:hypothetical protein